MSSNNILQNYVRYSRPSRISIDHDVAMLIEMGYDDKLIEKVYNILHPRDITQAINYMTKENNLYNHPFSSGRKSNLLCLICNEPIHNHFNSDPEVNYIENQRGIKVEEEDDVNSGSLSDEDNHHSLKDSLLLYKNISHQTPVHENNPISNGKNIQLEDLSEITCRICECDLSPEEQKNNTLICQHFFCDDCWYEQLKQKITDNQVVEMTCANFQCQIKLTENFIYSHLKGDKKLKQKYEDFKEKSSIVNDPTKKFCPTPNCKSFLQKGLENNFVSCENGHKWCYECLKAWHMGSTCEEIQDKDFQIWSKGKIIKRCPNCKIYTEKNEGCNHMTCTECKYQWCWLCEGKYTYGHYGDNGPCKGLQFKKINYLNELSKNEQIILRRRRPVLTHENIERYIGPDSEELKTTLRNTTLYLINNHSNTKQNNNVQNRNNLTIVNYYPVLEIDDDLKVPLDDYFNDVREYDSNAYVFPRYWHYFWGILTPPMYLYPMMFCECLHEIQIRWLRFILNLFGIICSLSITICYFFYALIICNILHIIFFCLEGKSLFASINTGMRVGLKDMKRIRRYKRFKFVEENNINNNSGNNNTSDNSRRT